MKAKLLLLVSLFFMSVTIPNAFAQGLTGRAYYKSSNMIRLKMDSTERSPDQMAEIQAQLNKQMEKDYILSFTQTESNWKQAESLGGGPATASSGVVTMVINTGNEDRLLYKNIGDQTFQQEEDLMGKEFLVMDTLKIFDWELTGESKKIGEYLCQKAIFSRIVESSSFSSGMEEMEKVKDTVKVVAWFAPQIPVSHGPADFWGLPGLILELQNHGMTYICEKIVLNPAQEPVAIEVPKKGEKISQEEYRALADEKMKEMMNRYSGKPGEGNQFTIRIGN